MTESEKLDLILEKMDGLDVKMENLETRMGSLETKVGSLETKVGNLETKVESLETKVESLDVKADRLEAGVGEVNGKVTKVETVLENEIRVNIQRVAEGHLDLSRNLHDAMRPSDEVEMLAIKVRMLETDVRELKAKIS